MSTDNVKILGVPENADEVLWALSELSNLVHTGAVDTVMWSVIMHNHKTITCVGKQEGRLWLTVIGMLEEIKRYIQDQW